MPRFLTLVAGLAVLGVGAFWFISAPKPLNADALAGLKPDPVHGEQVFWAGGCAACHADPEAKGDDKLLLGGGQSFATAFGTFVAPNISSDPVNGIGTWTTLDLVNAVTRGVSPEGTHYYPVFPYPSYARASLQDIVDLRAFLATVPAVATPSPPHQVAFPFNIRRLMGGWKFLFLRPGWIVTAPLTPEEERGRYLVESLGHCGECHTPRNALGGPRTAQWLGGGATPDGKEKFPNITPAKLDWSKGDIVAYLTTGFTPDFDSAGGHMALVVENTAHLPDSDRAAIAAYLAKVPPVE